MFTIVFLLLHCMMGIYDSHRLYMDRTVYFEKINVNFSWSINIETSSIYMEIVAPLTTSNSWVAFGISDTGGMKGADIALISLYHSKIYDLHSSDFAIPIMDKVQNFKLTHLQMSDAHEKVIIQFHRHLISCDIEDYNIDTTRLKHNIMIAYNDNDGLLYQSSDYKLLINMHTNTDTKELNLFLKDELFMNEQQNDQYFDIIFDTNFTITKRNGTTQYHCMNYNNTIPRYITGFDILDATENNLLHHASWSSCKTLIFNSNPHVCGSHFEMECATFVALARGSSVTIPSKAHYLMEEALYNLEMHFDLVGVSDNDFNVDGCGIRFYYVDEPREKALGIFRTEGSEFEIPPHQKQYDLSFAMHSECTNKLLPPNGVDIVFFGGHMHNYGSSIKLDRIRYPNELSTIYKLKQWDFNRQFPSYVYYTLKPNDTLIGTCTFDTSDRDNITYWGLTSADEMCMIFIGYVYDYRLTNLTMVYSVPVHDHDKNQLFNPTYCGPIVIREWNDTTTNVNKNSVYNNTLRLSANDNNLKIMDEKNKLCHALVFEEANLISNDIIWRFDLPYVTLFPGILLLLCILFSLYLIEKILYFVSPGIYGTIKNNDNDRRKINIYVFSSLFYTFLLVLLLHTIITSKLITDSEETLIYYEFETNKGAMDYPHQVAYTSNLTIMWFGIELLYRYQVQWHLILHHVFTIIIIVTLSTSLQTTLSTSTPSKLGFYYLLQIATEQPIFIALFARKLNLTCFGCLKPTYYKYLFYMACIWHYITKIGTTVMISYYVILLFIDTDCDYWYLYNISYSTFLKYDPIVYNSERIDWSLFVQAVLMIITPVLFILQLYQGYFFWVLATPIIDKNVLNMKTSMEYDKEFNIDNVVLGINAINVDVVVTPVDDVLHTPITPPPTFVPMCGKTPNVSLDTLQLIKYDSARKQSSDAYELFPPTVMEHCSDQPSVNTLNVAEFITDNATGGEFAQAKTN
eukprot:417303_1